MPASTVMTTETVRAVRNAEDFKEDLRRNSDAAESVFIIRTREPFRLQDVIQDLTVEDESAFGVWTCTNGWARYRDVTAGAHVNPEELRKPLSSDKQTSEITKALESVLRETKDGFYVMIHPHSHFDKLMVQQYIREIAYRGSFESHVRLVMIVPGNAKIPLEMEEHCMLLDFKTPSHSELLDCYAGTLKAVEEEYRPPFDDNEVATVVQNAVGMTWAEFEKALSLATIDMQEQFAEDKDQITPQDYIKFVLKQKVEVIKKTDILELMPTSDMTKIGGLDLLKSWMAKRSKAYSAEAREYGLEIPKGVLCVGPPGAGKSLFAKASASVFGVPLIKLDIGRIFGKFVGDSESRMREALKMVEAMAPCCLLIDEIDKGFGGVGGGGDSGVGQRVLGTFLTWLQERDNDKAPVFVVMTANNVTGLPAELMRKGRIDEIFAVTFPSERERMDILKIHLSARGHTLSDADLRKIAAATHNFVGAELESIIVEGIIEAFDRDMPKPTAAVFLEVASGITPLSKSQADKVNFMNDWAKHNAKPASSGMSFDPIEGEPASPQRQVSVGKRPLLRKPAPGRSLDG